MSKVQCRGYNKSFNVSKGYTSELYGGDMKGMSSERGKHIQETFQAVSRSQYGL